MLLEGEYLQHDLVPFVLECGEQTRDTSGGHIPGTYGFVRCVDKGHRVRKEVVEKEETLG